MEKEGCQVLAVKVIPNASCSEIVGWEGETLKVRIKAVAEKGKANEELIRLLAKEFGVPKSGIKILSGKTSRNKRIKIVR